MFRGVWCLAFGGLLVCKGLVVGYRYVFVGLCLVVVVNVLIYCLVGLVVSL